MGVFDEEELREFLDRASDAETIEDDEAQMVQSVFEMDDTPHPFAHGSAYRHAHRQP